MTQYDNTNRGTLGKNQRREKDSHPEYSGQIDVNGVGYWLSAWVKEGQNGKFFSLSVRPKDEQQKPKQNVPAPADDQFNDDSDIPF
jgi:hypothetical protein